MTHEETREPYLFAYFSARSARSSRGGGSSSVIVTTTRANDSEAGIGNISSHHSMHPDRRIGKNIHAAGDHGCSQGHRSHNAIRSKSEHNPAGCPSDAMPARKATDSLSGINLSSSGKALVKRTLDEHDRFEALKFLSRLRRGLSQRHSIAEIERLKAKLDLNSDGPDAEGSGSVFFEPGEVDAEDRDDMLMRGTECRHSRSKSSSLV